MNDEQVMTAVRDSFAPVRLGAPLEQTVRRGRLLRGRRRAYRVAGVAGAAAIVGVTAVAVTGLGRSAPGPASAQPGSSRAAGPGSTRLDAWTVTHGADGAVDVTVRQLEDAAGLQRALRAAGIPAQVAFQDGPPSDSPPLPADCADVDLSDEANAALQAKILGLNPPPSLATLALVLYPQQIPPGVGIYLAIQSGSSDQGWGWGLDLVKATPACTG